jgi:hypothetical protein
MPNVQILEQHGLPLYSTSPESYAAQLEATLLGLELQYGPVVGIVDKQFGRATYHFAIYTTPVEVPAEVPVEAPAKAPRPKTAKATTAA